MTEAFNQKTTELPVNNEDVDVPVGEGYRIKLSDFEGPLDTLLYLIKKSKMSIRDVKISEITQQFLDYLVDLDTLDLEMASEFLTMAAWLLEIKSKSLLPKPEEPVDEEFDEEKKLKRQLEEYSLLKDASLKMKEIETVDVIYREPDPSVGKPQLVLKDMTKDGLLNALKKMFARFEERAALLKERHIVMDRFSVSEMVDMINAKLKLSDQITFYELFSADFSKSEIITTFQAILELLKNQIVKAEQNGLFNEIILHKVEENNDET